VRISTDSARTPRAVVDKVMRALRKSDDPYPLHGAEVATKYCSPTNPAAQLTPAMFALYLAEDHYKVRIHTAPLTTLFTTPFTPSRNHTQLNLVKYCSHTNSAAQLTPAMFALYLAEDHYKVRIHTAPLTTLFTTPFTPSRNHTQLNLVKYCSPTNPAAQLTPAMLALYLAEDHYKVRIHTAPFTTPFTTPCTFSRTPITPKLNTVKHCPPTRPRSLRRPCLHSTWQKTTTRFAFTLRHSHPIQGGLCPQVIRLRDLQVQNDESLSRNLLVYMSNANLPTALT